MSQFFRQSGNQISQITLFFSTFVYSLCHNALLEKSASNIPVLWLLTHDMNEYLICPF